MGLQTVLSGSKLIPCHQVWNIPNNFSIIYLFLCAPGKRNGSFWLSNKHSINVPRTVEIKAVCLRWWSDPHTLWLNTSLANLKPRDCCVFEHDVILFFNATSLVQLVTLVVMNCGKGWAGWMGSDDHNLFLAVGSPNQQSHGQKAD